MKHKKRKLNIRSFSSFGSALVLKNILFIMFMVFLGVVYIANVHYAQRMVRKIAKVEAEVKKMKWEYNFVKSELVAKSTQSGVAKRLNQNDLLLNTNDNFRVVIK